MLRCCSKQSLGAWEPRVPLGALGDHARCGLRHHRTLGRAVSCVGADPTDGGARPAVRRRWLLTRAAACQRGPRPVPGVPARGAEAHHPQRARAPAPETPRAPCDRKSGLASPLKRGLQLGRQSDTEVSGLKRVAVSPLRASGGGATPAAQGAGVKT